MFAHLFLQILAQITIFAKLHHNIKFISRLKRLVETDDMLVVQFFHKQALLERFLLLLAAHTTKIYLFYYVDSLVFLGDDSVDDSKRPMAQFLFKLELT